MDNPKFPHGNNVPLGIDKLNMAFRQGIEPGGHTFNGMNDFLGDDIPFSTDDLLPPDTYGAERIFIEFFVSDDMTDDFPLIARDFYLHEFANIAQYEDLEYLDIDQGDDWPELMFNRFTLSLMMNAVNCGSEYTRALFKHLYKTYYKSEYKVLKRFSHISQQELISLADPESGRSFSGNMARILCISAMYGITIDPDCYRAYDFLNDCSEEMDSDERYTFEEATGEAFQQCLKEIEENYDQKRLYALDSKASKFLGNVLKWLGYSPDFADWCDENDQGLIRRLATTLSILRKTFPSKEVTEEELVFYSMIVHAASALTCNMDWMVDTLKTLAYGEDGTYFYEEFPSKFRPEDVQTGRVQTQKKEPVDRTKKAEPLQDTDKDSERTKALLAEIDTLRRKVHKLETDNNNLRVDLADKRRAEEKAKKYGDQLEAANRELVALRDYVYNLTEDDSMILQVSVEAMKEKLSKQRIVIIGGHSNWVSKMKKEFPEWVYVNPEASGSTDVSIVDKADHVYFFTDTISHSKYYQFMNVVREKKADFGYIHGVNIEKNIRSIYRDFEE